MVERLKSKIIMSNSFDVGQDVYYTNTYTNEEVECTLYKTEDGNLYIKEKKSGKKRRIEEVYWNKILFHVEVQTSDRSEQKKKRNTDREDTGSSMGFSRETRYSKEYDYDNEGYNRMDENGWKYNERKLSQDGEGVMDLKRERQNRKK